MSDERHDDRSGRGAGRGAAGGSGGRHSHGGGKPSGRGGSRQDEKNGPQHGGRAGDQRDGQARGNQGDRRATGNRGHDSGSKRDRPREDRGKKAQGHPGDRRQSASSRENGKHFDTRRDSGRGGRARDDRATKPSNREGKPGKADRSDRPRKFDRTTSDQSKGGRTGPKRFERDRENKVRHPKERSGRPPQKSREEAQQRKVKEKTTHSTVVEPELPEDAVASELHGEVRRELKALPKTLADKISAHLVAAGTLVDSEPERALAHARYARQRASRIGVVREANGIAAYQAAEWSESLSELRAARRMGGGSEHLAIMADCERALGRPERALDLTRTREAAELARSEAVELRIVAAGARRDLGEIDASVVSLQIPELDPQRQEPWSARLFYAYADNLLAADRVQEAFTWFVHAAHADDEAETDAPDRLDELVERLGGVATARELVARAESQGSTPEPEAEPE